MIQSPNGKGLKHRCSRKGCQVYLSPAHLHPWFIDGNDTGSTPLQTGSGPIHEVAEHKPSGHLSLAGCQSQVNWLRTSRIASHLPDKITSRNSRKRSRLARSRGTASSSNNGPTSRAGNRIWCRPQDTPAMGTVAGPCPARTAETLVLERLSPPHTRNSEHQVQGPSGR